MMVVMSYWPSRQRFSDPGDKMHKPAEVLRYKNPESFLGITAYRLLSNLPYKIYHLRSDGFFGKSIAKETRI